MDNGCRFSLLFPLLEMSNISIDILFLHGRRWILRQPHPLAVRSPIRAFRVDGGGKCDTYYATCWLRSLSRTSIMNLTLRPRSLLGPTLFSWSALIRLHLERCHMPLAAHGFSSFFPSLLSLLFNHVALPFMGGGVQLECLIAATPRLAVLNLSFVYTLSDGDSIDMCAIRPPNLRKLLFAIMGAMDNDC
uniref:Uncharacterized protein n=1 Tax=Leersia perrieri TaxID=77586 RepID=A0A0D9X5U7_9ORYZ